MSEPGQPQKDPPGPATGEEPKLSNAELKKRQKAEKQAKRAARKETEGIDPSATPSSSKTPPPPPQNQKPAQKPQQPKQQQPPKQNQLKMPTQRRGQPAQQNRGLELFKNLRLSDDSEFETPEDVNEKVTEFVERMLDKEFQGSTARCIGLIECLKAVISDYEVPEDNTLSRHFLPECLSKQVDYIKHFRPLSIGMDNIVKYLEASVVKVDPSLSSAEAKYQLLAKLDEFWTHRIKVPASLIIRRLVAEIQDGDVILTYSNSSLVSQGVIAAFKVGKKFKVIVVDSSPTYEGRAFSSTLSDAGVPSEYFIFSNLSTAVGRASKVLIGGQGMFNDGKLWARSGTAVVAMHARAYKLPVIACCQSFKFSEDIRTDPYAQNEAASAEGFLGSEKNEKLWEEKAKDMPLLRIVNPLYDLTPNTLLSAVLCDFGLIKPESVSDVYRLVGPQANQTEA